MKTRPLLLEILQPRVSKAASSEFDVRSSSLLRAVDERLSPFGFAAKSLFIRANGGAAYAVSRGTSGYFLHE